MRKDPPGRYAEGAPMAPRPMGAVLAPNGREVLVSLGRATSIATITIEGRKLAGTIEGVGGRPWGIDVNTEGTKAYTANGPSGDVSIVDLAATTRPWSITMATNTPTLAPKAPVFIAQGTGDHIVNVKITDLFVQQLCRQGATVDYVKFNGVSHHEIAKVASTRSVAAMFRCCSASTLLPRRKRSA